MSPDISQITSSNSFQQSLRDSGINIKDGQVVRATVLKILPDGGTLLSVNGKQLDIPTPLNLREGSKLLLQVTLTGSKIEFRPVENISQKPGIPASSESAGPAKENLSGIISDLKAALDQAELNNITAQGAKDLKQIMQSILYNDPGKNNGTWVKENVLAGGMLWENKIAEFLSEENNLSVKKLLKGDLKAVLLSLKKILETEDSNHTSTAALKVKQALSQIENMQLQNLTTLEDGLGWLFFIPGLVKDGFDKAEIFVKKRDAGKGISFSVVAEFTQLGRFEARVSMMDSMTSIRILMDDKEKADIVTGNLSALESSIKAIGLVNVALSCDVRKSTDMPGGFAYQHTGHSQPFELVV